MAHDRSSELELERLVVEGSFGRIFRARYKATSSIIAVKVVLESDEVRNEIHFLSKCNSPFVVGYFGSFVSGSDRWVMTDYCGGGFVSDYLVERAGSDYSMPEECIRAVCVGIVLGLEYLHTSDVCHRNIRCNNVLLTNAGYIKLTGFRFSAQLDEVTKTCKSVKGSTCWMAPEVINGEHYDGKADIWSLGITTLELVEGAPPRSSLKLPQAIRIIPSKPMAEFIDCCCKENPRERRDPKALISHAFVQSEVSRGRSGSPLFPWHLISKP